MATTALILAAGKGERMQSETPKVLHPLLGRPLIHYPMELASQVGVRKKIVVVGYQAGLVKEALKGSGAEFVFQKNQKGTAHAVGVARQKLSGFQGDLLILYGDVPLLKEATLRQLLTVYKKSGAALALLSAHFENPTGYGRVVRNGNGEIREIVEEKDATPEQKRIREVNTGLMVVRAPLLFSVLDEIQKSVVSGEYYLTDVIRHLVERGDPVVSVSAASESEVLGINNRLELARAEKIMRQRIVEQWIHRGVQFADLDRVVVGPDVVIGKGSEIGPDCFITGRTKIGYCCRLQQGVVIESSTLADGVHVKPYSVIVESHVGSGSIIGPFAHLRPGTKLAEKVHIGNFVETKKSSLGKGSKANHLTYLGDAVIGKGVNVGAGTITCNYDGFNKYKTILADNVFVGSDTQFVAPVRVGKGGWVGAGTTVTKNVPAGALAVSRVEQKNILNWKKKGKKK
ncbi:MAG: bifunctional UDP-N-acetylglucosamine diphosphorylase/glucosamine-1-phosphate N-acetyltransferase GlmU [Deltaproteobacteria bacterium]|nr:bifunctional UDP-N-acetylglucosamine diphosphorylase/glucosamine-1-phosphate N-acetyltransferase GlmU [Deltaproteobacteria bacterium]